MKVGYFISEFPSVTHTFFWRDIEEIEAMGVEVEIISTRLPSGAMPTHQWVDVALRRTFYLYTEILNYGWDAFCLLKSPLGVAKVLSTIAKLKNVGVLEKIKIMALIPFAKRLTSFARKAKLHVVYVPFPANAAYVALFANILDGMPYCLGHHASAEAFGRGVNLQAKWSRAIFGFAITEKLKNELDRQILRKIPIYIAPMGVELGKFTRKKPIGYRAGDTFKIVSCGRFVPTKGFLELLDAIAILKQRGHPISLTIAGEYDEKKWFYNHFMRRLREKSVEREIKLMGAASEDEVCDLLNSANLFVLPTHDEGLGVAIMEAMAMELPVVAGNVGGVPLLVDHETTGFLVDGKDAESIAIAIINVIENYDSAIKMGKLARKKIEGRFSSKVGAEVMVNALRTHVEGGIASRN